MDRSAPIQAALSLLQCPLCASELTHAGSSLKCARGHDFALSRTGYCDFAPNKSGGLYTKELFESRRRVMSGRLYGPFRDKLRSLLDSFAPDGAVLDAGCGEGTFTKALAGENRAVFGVDLAREGIRLAVKGGTDMGYFVGDLARLPFRDGSLRAVVNVLSPAAYSEFRRVLAPDGILLKVVPGEGYLGEIRSLVRDDLKPAGHADGSAFSLFSQHCELLAQEEVRYTLPLAGSEAADLLRMTPLTEHVEGAELLADRLDRITVHLMFLIGRVL